MSVTGPQSAPLQNSLYSLSPTLKSFTLCTATRLLHSIRHPDPSAFPSLKTLIFSNCVITEEFMGELTRFASNHKNTTREACTGR